VARRTPEVGPVELFFDLVYVFAIIQLSHLLIDRLTWEGMAQTAVLFAAVWWGWNYTAWAMNWLDPGRIPVQLLTGVLMLAALGMAIAIPGAFGAGAGMFVACALFMGVLRPLFMIVAFRGSVLSGNYRLLLIWTLAAGAFWIAGCFVEPAWRLPIWLVAVLLDYAAPLFQFRVPLLGSAPMETWDTDPEHLAERNRLVFIIALGESVLLMGGAAVYAGGLDARLGLDLVLGFATLFLLWWNYFAVARHDVRGEDESTAALRTAYAYAHAAMVFGAILIAVSIELRLSHDHLTPAIVLVSVAGPAVYLVGNLLFLCSRPGGFGRLARSRVAAVAALAGIGAVGVPLADVLPPAALGLGVLAVMLVLAVLTGRPSPAPSDPDALSDPDSDAAPGVGTGTASAR
jgi:low temperature requirement protein LtrA